MACFRVGFAGWPWERREHVSRRALEQIAERVEALERKLPAYLVDMEGLAARCEEVLDRASQRAARARMAERRAREARGEEPVENQPSLPMTAAQALARLRKKRRGLAQFQRG